MFLLIIHTPLHTDAAYAFLPAFAMQARFRASPSFSLGLSALCILRKSAVRARPPPLPWTLLGSSCFRHASSIPGFALLLAWAEHPMHPPYKRRADLSARASMDAAHGLVRDQYSNDSMYFMYFTIMRAILKVIASSNTRRSRPVLF